jgi:hypothetical protein
MFVLIVPWWERKKKRRVRKKEERKEKKRKEKKRKEKKRKEKKRKEKKRKEDGGWVSPQKKHKSKVPTAINFLYVNLRTFIKIF